MELPLAGDEPQRVHVSIELDDFRGTYLYMQTYHVPIGTMVSQLFENTVKMYHNLASIELAGKCIIFKWPFQNDQTSAPAFVTEDCTLYARSEDYIAVRPEAGPARRER